MAFGMEGAPQMHWSKENLKNALWDLENLQQSQKTPIFFDSNKVGNTGELDGKYFAMGYELEKNEYENFIGEIKEVIKIYNEVVEAENSGKVIKMNNNLEEDYNKAV